jgi:ketosteroid isomerase-like protein
VDRSQSTDPAAIAVQFNDTITRQDIDGLTALMTSDHTFTDTEGNSVAGRPACRDAWQSFFAAFPDYRNVFHTISTHGDLVIITGHSVCSEPALAGPAIWTATISGDQISHWAVLEDTPSNRHSLGLPEPAGHKWP